MIFTLLALLGAIVASYTDLKHGIIQNKLTIGLFTIGIIGHLLLKGVSVLGPLLTSTGLIFILGFAFWHLGGWSAGDAKEFLFLAALLPEYPAWLDASFNPVHGPYPFILTIFINTFLAIFPFIFLWGIYLSFKQSKLKKFIPSIKKTNSTFIDALFITGALLLTLLLKINPLFVGPLVLISYKLSERTKVGISITTVLFYVIQTSEIMSMIQYFILVFVSIMAFWLFWNSIQLLRKEALQETIALDALKEGTVLSEAIYTGENKIETGARGLTMEEVDALKKSQKQKGIAEITIKRTIPFAPVILIGLLISLSIGDLIMVVSHA